MKVFKFGGASINSTDRIKNVAAIVAAHAQQPLVIIISAMGKTTNALEQVAETFYSGNREQAIAAFSVIKKDHDAIAEALGVYAQAQLLLKDIYTEIEWLLHDKPVRNFDYYYDQIVCSGELLSTAIVSSFFKQCGLNAAWLDVRDIMRTDDNFREAGIDWGYTTLQVQEKVLPLFTNNTIVVTQGFIGATDENESTTLGREGSDYSAAIFANLLQAESQTIWKDVPGVMNADPKKYADAQFISHLSFNEVIEMAYYGATVIHPKTIKPLQNKNIPLHVRCFLAPELPGTIIGESATSALPPIIIEKPAQALLQLSSRDFSFIADQGIGRLYQLFAAHQWRPNIIQTGAISLLCSFDDRPDKIEKLALAASEWFDVTVEKNIRLLTIRHYNTQVLESLRANQQILLEQRTSDTIQWLLK
jgi:aspartate kinase